MTLQEAIEARHSVRAYKNEPLAEDASRQLEEEIAEVNQKGRLHIQLIQDEPKAFQGTLAKYGKFRNVTSYLVMAGKKADDLDERIGYYGEHLVLLAQTLGLNTCWVGLSYKKIPDTYVLDEGEVIKAYIAIGYGETQGTSHKIKTVEQVSRSAVKPLGSTKNASETTFPQSRLPVAFAFPRRRRLSVPSWFKQGVEAALLAPTAVNQQKFSFEYVGMKDNRHQVRAKKGFSMIGYTQMDLGIAKYHFEIGAGKACFEWI